MMKYATLGGREKSSPAAIIDEVVYYWSAARAWRGGRLAGETRQYEATCCRRRAVRILFRRKKRQTICDK
jgi:hypothetical protein